MKAPFPTKSVAILAVSDVRKTVAYYKDVLGFTEHWFWEEDPPGFGGVCWGDIQLMFNLQPEIARHVTGHQHSIFVGGVDDLYARHKKRAQRSSARSPTSHGVCASTSSKTLTDIISGSAKAPASATRRRIVRFRRA